MSESQKLIEALAKQKTAWLDDFKETYQKSRTAKSKAQRERLTVSVINTNSGQKNK